MSEAQTPEEARPALDTETHARFEALMNSRWSASGLMLDDRSVPPWHELRGWVRPWSVDIHSAMVDGDGDDLPDAIHLRVQPCDRKAFCAFANGLPDDWTPCGVDDSDASPRPEVLRDLLSLVMESPPSVDYVATWTPAQCAAAEKWAGALHLAASDNDVTVPDAPRFLVPSSSAGARFSLTPDAERPLCPDGWSLCSEHSNRLVSDGGAFDITIYDRLVRVEGPGGAVPLAAIDWLRARLSPADRDAGQPASASDRAGTQDVVGQVIQCDAKPTGRVSEHEAMERERDEARARADDARDEIGALRAALGQAKAETQAAIDASKARQADLVAENDRLREDLRRARNDLRACATTEPGPLDARAEFEPKGGALAVDPYELATALGWHGPAFGMVEAVAMLRGALTEDRTALATVVTQRDEALAENEDLRSATWTMAGQCAPDLTGRPAQVAAFVERVLATCGGVAEQDFDLGELARLALALAFPEETAREETATDAMVAIHREEIADLRGELEAANAEVERLTDVGGRLAGRLEGLREDLASAIAALEGARAAAAEERKHAATLLAWVRGDLNAPGPWSARSGRVYGSNGVTLAALTCDDPPNFAAWANAAGQRAKFVIDGALVGAADTSELADTITDLLKADDERGEAVTAASRLLVGCGAVDDPRSRHG